jgi:hypothetical protein
VCDMHRVRVHDERMGSNRCRRTVNLLLMHLSVIMRVQVVRRLRHADAVLMLVHLGMNGL